MPTMDHEDLVALLASPPDASTAQAVTAIRDHGLVYLLNGVAAPIATITTQSGLTDEEIRLGIQVLIDAGRIEIQDDSILGVAGMTLNPTTHSVRLPTSTVFTWCALDAIGIPAARNLIAQVQTTCPHCDQGLSVQVAHGGATSAQSITLFFPTGVYRNLRVDFCSTANLFCSPAHLVAWRSAEPMTTGEQLSLADTVVLGKALWGTA